MKLSREEFKELYALYDEAWSNFHEYGDIINENLLDELIFPLFNWVETRAGIKSDSIDNDFDIIGDLHFYGHYPIEWEEDENGECCNVVNTADLDVIYDKYIGGN